MAIKSVRDQLSTKCKLAINRKKYQEDFLRKHLEILLFKPEDIKHFAVSPDSERVVKQWLTCSEGSMIKDATRKRLEKFLGDFLREHLLQMHYDEIFRNNPVLKPYHEAAHCARTYLDIPHEIDIDEIEGTLDDDGKTIYNPYPSYADVLTSRFRIYEKGLKEAQRLLNPFFLSPWPKRP
jgi:hypothetical protein